jgi:hypothetical protein
MQKFLSSIGTKPDRGEPKPGEQVDIPAAEIMPGIEVPRRRRAIPADFTSDLTAQLSLLKFS